MHRLSQKLTEAIFESLGGDSAQVKKDFADSRDTSLVRMNYYPVCLDADTHLGVGPHADPSALTILAQVRNFNHIYLISIIFNHLRK